MLTYLEERKMQILIEMDEKKILNNLMSFKNTINDIRNELIKVKKEMNFVRNIDSPETKINEDIKTEIKEGEISISRIFDFSGK